MKRRDSAQRQNVIGSMCDATRDSAEAASCRSNIYNSRFAGTVAKAFVRDQHIDQSALPDRNAGSCKGRLAFKRQTQSSEQDFLPECPVANYWAQRIILMVLVPARRCLAHSTRCAFFLIAF